MLMGQTTRKMTIATDRGLPLSSWKGGNRDLQKKELIDLEMIGDIILSDTLHLRD